MNRPPASLEAFFARLIPPACREEVLGDLCEKYRSPFQYFFLAARTIPFVIVSRLRRISGPVLSLTDPVLIYGGFLLEAWIGHALLRPDPATFLLLAAPAALTWIYLVLCEVFAPASGKPATLKQAGLVVMVVFMGTLGHSAWLFGFFSAWLLVSLTRLLSPANFRRGRLAKSQFSHKAFAVFTTSYVLLHFSGSFLRIAAGILWLLTIIYVRLKRRAAR